MPQPRNRRQATGSQLAGKAPPATSSKERDIHRHEHTGQPCVLPKLPARPSSPPVPRQPLAPPPPAPAPPAWRRCRGPQSPGSAVSQNNRGEQCRPSQKTNQKQRATTNNKCRWMDVPDFGVGVERCTAVRVGLAVLVMMRCWLVADGLHWRAACRLGAKGVGVGVGVCFVFVFVRG